MFNSFKSNTIQFDTDPYHFESFTISAWIRDMSTGSDPVMSITAAGSWNVVEGLRLETKAKI